MDPTRLSIVNHSEQGFALAKKLPPDVQAHLHADIDVTPERVRAFGKADYASRLRVLAVLRARDSDQSTTSMIAIGAITVSLLFVLVKPPQALDLTGGVIWVTIAGVVVVSVGIVLMLLPAIVPGVIGNADQQRARVWLGAYEDEVVRRQARGKK